MHCFPWLWGKRTVHVWEPQARSREETKMDYARRLTALQDAMREHDADLAVYGTCQNYLYLTGIPVDWRAAPDSLPAGCDVFVPREGKAVATAPGPIEVPESCEVRSPDAGQSYESLVRGILSDLQLKPRKVGLGANLPGPSTLAVVAAASGAEFCDASRWLDRVRMIKEPEEIERLRRVARLTDEVMEKVVSGISNGISQNELALQIEMEARRRGATNMSFAPFAGFMKHGAGASEHIANVPPDQGLSPNTAICFDIGFVLNGYASDWGRSVYWESRRMTPSRPIKP